MNLNLHPCTPSPPGSQEPICHGEHREGDLKETMWAEEEPSEEETYYAASQEHGTTLDPRLTFAQPSLFSLQ